MQIPKPYIKHNKILIETSFEENLSSTESTTVMMSTELTTEPIPDEEQLTWRVISMVFIILTAFLLILSICLWRALPSNTKSTQVSRGRSRVSMQEPPRSQEIVY